MLTRANRGGWIAPFDALMDVQHELNRLFDGTEQGRDGGRVLAADVIETADEVLVTMEAPGLGAEDLEITIENNVLRISGEKRSEQQTGEGSAWRLRERRFGRFERSFVLPPEVRSDSCDASYDQGVLTVSLPKREEARPRRIEIRNGSQAREVGEGSTTS